MPSLATCLERFGVPSEPPNLSSQAVPRLYLGAFGLQAVQPLPKLQVQDVSHVRTQEQGGISWMRTPSPSTGRRLLPARAWALSPVSFSSRTSPSRSTKGRRSPLLNSLTHAPVEKPKKGQGLQRLLERQNTWRRKQESRKQQKDSQSLPRPQLSSDARREIKSDARREIKKSPAAWDRSGTPSRQVSKQDPEEVSDKTESVEWQNTLRSLGWQNNEPSEFEKAVQVAKSYNFPVREVKARLDEFRKFKNGRDTITIGQFCDEIKEEYELEHETLVASFVKAGSMAEHGVLDFETFLLWSMKTDFLEEILVPDPQERHFRQVVREYQLHPGEIDNIRTAYDSFDLNGNGFIDHWEFKHLLCKLRMMKNEGDIPEPELKRCWHDACPVDQESQVINFEQFLIWILKSGELARYREMRYSDDLYF